MCAPWSTPRRSACCPHCPPCPCLRFQALHTDDAAEAFRVAVVRPVNGPFNPVADPVLNTAVVATALAAAWRVHLVPADPGLPDAVL
ncbi:hypothetical protein ACIGBH_37605 [Streptomyces sp. NPDC085929]|uniref:hypothetical protein n=1 Tax=Streptomyces sp. NPDC085929 TaxID=3365739 RepID=UPI0037D3DB32